MYFTIYKTTNLLNHKFYIGKHVTTNPDDSYMGSGRAIKAAIKKYGKENFTKEVLYIFDNEDDMNAMEAHLVTINENSYNMSPGGRGGFGYINENGLNVGDNNIMRKSPEAKRKCIESNKKTRAKNKEYYNEIYKKNLSVAIQRQIGAKRPAHSQRMKEMGYLKKRWVDNKDEMRDKLSSWFELISPQGEIIKTNRLGDYCTENGLGYVALWQSSKTNKHVSKGKSKGWICRKI